MSTQYPLKISQLIKRLQQAQFMYGDLPLVCLTEQLEVTYPMGYPYPNSDHRLLHLNIFTTPE